MDGTKLKKMELFMKSNLRNRSLFIILPLFLALFAAVLSDTTGWAKAPPLGLSSPDRPREYQQQGELISVRLVPGAKQSQLFVVGKETAKIKFEDSTVSATLFFGDQTKEILFKRNKDHYVTTEKLDKGELKLNLNVNSNTEQLKKSEQFNIKLIND
jgi:hypothetical protein